MLRGGIAEFERASVEIERVVLEGLGPAALLSHLATLASLRYDKGEVGRIVDPLRRKKMFSTEAFKVSWLYQDGLAEGLAEGKAAGKAEGKTEGKRHAILALLRKRFPGEDFPSLDEISADGDLDSLLFAINDAADLSGAREAIQKHSRAE